MKGRAPAEDLDLSYRGVNRFGSLFYDLRVERAGSEIVVRGGVRMAVEFLCSRCLRPAVKEIRSDDLIYSVTLKEDEIIDLTERIREDIILALPLKPLCDEGCRGICPGCGKDLNEGPCGCDRGAGDHRWDSLSGMTIPPEE